MSLAFVAGLFLITGIILSLGAYGVARFQQFKTLTIFILPFLHLITAWGLIKLKKWARYLGFYICFFYAVLFIFVLYKSISLVDYIPFVPLIEYVPVEILRWPGVWVMYGCLFALPLSVMAVLSLKHTTAFFEPLQPKYAWPVPFLVLAAGAFSFSYLLLAHTEISFFTTLESRKFFLWYLTPLQGMILKQVEFYLLMILAFGLIRPGGLIAWMLAFFFTAYYWSPVFTANNPKIYWKDDQFLFIGAAWIAVCLCTILYWRFFVDPSGWYERRKVFSKTSLMTAVVSILLIAGGAYLVLEAPQIQSRTQKKIKKEKKARQPVHFEGFITDSRGVSVIVNGEIASVGRSIEGYKIEKVGQNGVLFSKDGESFELDQQNNWRKLG